MGRPELHDEDSLLDSARSVVLGSGARRATIAAVAAASRAPTGSIYHRFGSVDELLARAWIRAARRSQASALAALGADVPQRSVVAGALAMYDFCLASREDALLLTSFRYADFADANVTPELRRELEQVNEPLSRPLKALARDLFGRADRRSLDLMVLAMVDVPYGFARRHLEAGTRPPPGLRHRLERAVRAIIDDGER